MLICDTFCCKFIFVVNHNLLYSYANIYVSIAAEHTKHSFIVVMPTKEGQQQKGTHPYELIRLTQCMRNNARLKQLGHVDEGGENISKVLIPPSLSCHIFVDYTKTLNMDVVLIDVSIVFFRTL
jgi:hypothetical protein